jgi:hypothetical protein
MSINPYQSPDSPPEIAPSEVVLPPLKSLGRLFLSALSILLGACCVAIAILWLWELARADFVLRERIRLRIPPSPLEGEGHWEVVLNDVRYFEVLGISCLLASLAIFAIGVVLLVRPSWLTLPRALLAARPATK